MPSSPPPGRGLPIADAVLAALDNAAIGATILVDHGTHQALAMRERVARVVAGERLAPMEYRGRRRDGSYALIEITSIATVFDGRPAIVAFGRDTTERKELLARVLQQDRLAAVGMLAAGVAHELNNPLTYVAMQLRRALDELGSTTRDDRRIAAALGEALDGTARMGAIVRELLALARDERVARAGVDVATVVRSAAKFALTAADNPIDVKLRLEPLPEIQTNGPRLAQVVINLLNNALQATRDAERNEIRVAAFARGDRVVIEVEDDGNGIAPEQLERVWEPFVTTRAGGAGTGLGLTISQSIVRSLGGTIGIESAPGRGTRVRIELPSGPPHDAP